MSMTSAKVHHCFNLHLGCDVCLVSRGMSRVHVVSHGVARVHLEALNLFCIYSINPKCFEMNPMYTPIL